MKNFIKKLQRHHKYARSQAQIKRQKKFRFCCSFWKRFLTDAQRDSWSKIAPPVLTGYNYFLRINLVRTFNDLGILVDPPE